MSRVLIVAHRTAQSPELLAAVKETLAKHPGAALDLLVPATPTQYLPGVGTGMDRAIAWKVAADAREHFERQGINLDGLHVGAPRPESSVRDLLETASYDVIVVSTLPKTSSRWIRQDVISRLRRKISVPIVHVVAHTAD